MLELRPACEHCANPLAPDSEEARICSFECTFCRACVEGVLRNVCPNCGGGFAARPVRPARDWKNGYFLGKYPSRADAHHSPVDLREHEWLAEALVGIPPRER